MELTRREAMHAGSAALIAATMADASVMLKPDRPRLAVYIVGASCPEGHGGVIHVKVFFRDQVPEYICSDCGKVMPFSHKKLMSVFSEDEERKFFEELGRSKYLLAISEMTRLNVHDAMRYKGVEPAMAKLRPGVPWPGDDFEKATLIEDEIKRGKAMKAAYQRMVAWYA